jgi:hypothetical protein
MFYTIYQITCIINKKIYIGKHQTNILNDGYMGSGKNLKRAISKYGIENFKKEILFQFYNEDEMNAKEAELVTEEFCLRQDTYNICVGGKGGWSYINSNGLQGGKFYSGGTKLIEAQQAMRERMKSPEFKKARSKKLADALEQTRKTNRYRGFEVDATIQQLATENARLVNTGSIIINNGIKNKRIRHDELIPDGWFRGRIKLQG